MSRLLTFFSIVAMCAGWGGFVARRSAVPPDAAPVSAARAAPLDSSIASVRSTPAATPSAIAAPSAARAVAVAASPECDASASAVVIAFGRGEARLDRRAIDLIDLLASELVPRPDTARRRRERTVRVFASSAAGESETRSARALAQDRLDAAKGALLRAGLWHLQLSEAQASVRADIEHGCVRIERVQPAPDAGGV